MVVCGATGRQGGAVIRRLLMDGNFDVVGLTRDNNSYSALEIQRLGAEIVIADTMRQDFLVKAFSGADCVFALTQPWNGNNRRYDTRTEILQAKNIIWASAMAGVGHVVLSSFINPQNERTRVNFIDSKLVIERLIQQKGVPYTIVRSPLFMDDINIPASGKKKVRNYYYANTPLPYLSLSDLGKIVFSIFSKSEQYIGKTITAISEIRTGQEIAGILSDITGIRHRYKCVSPLWLGLFNPEMFRLRLYMKALFEQKNELLLKETTFKAIYKGIQLMTVKDFLRAKMK